MATKIAERELRNSNAEILDRVEAGESFVVTRNGVPIADVVPHADPVKPPMFPTTSDLAMKRRVSAWLGPDREAWLRDIRGVDDVADDDPLDGSSTSDRQRAAYSDEVGNAPGRPAER